MKKSEEKKIYNLIVSLIDGYTDSDDILINDLIDWIKINHRAKDDLQESIKNGDIMSWQALTTIAMASKQIQSSLTRLGITPQQRNRGKKKEENKCFDLDKFLNEK